MIRDVISGMRLDKIEELKGEFDRYGGEVSLAHFVKLMHEKRAVSGSYEDGIYFSS